MSDQSDGFIVAFQTKQQCPDCQQWFLRLSVHTGRGTCIKAQAKLQQKAALDRAMGDTQAEPHDLRKLSQNVPLTPRVPRALRSKVASALTATLQSCVSSKSTAAWWKLLTFAYHALSLPGTRTKGKTKMSLRKVIDANIDRLDAGEQLDSSVRTFPVLNNEEKVAKRIQAKLRDGDVSGAVRLLTSEEPVIAPSPESLVLMKEKHPVSVEMEFPVLPHPAPNFAPVTAEEIATVIHGFKPGSSGGPGELTPQHLKDLIADSKNIGTRKLCEALADLVNVMLEGKVPSEIVKVLYGANLTALGKKDGGVRPIAVGTTLRRLAAKVICRRIQQPIGEALRPVQLGFGTRAGCESIVHIVRQFYTQQSDEVKVALKLDYKNAFNMVNRSRILQAALDHIPEYAPFVFQCYRHPTILSYGPYDIASERGVQQGDPLGPVLFSLATLAVANKLTSAVKLMYLDDTTVAGSQDDVLTDFCAVVRESEQLGLELNYSKCEVFIRNGSAEDCRAVKEAFGAVSTALSYPGDTEFSLLGSPVTDEAVPVAFGEKVVALKRFVSRLHFVCAHQGIFLLRNCGAIPKLQYVLRTSTVWNQPAFLHAFDKVVRDAIVGIINNPISEVEWTQASLPARRAGMGLRRSESLALPAFLASAYSVRGLFRQLNVEGFCNYVAEAETSWEQMTSSELPPDSLRAVQKVWDSPLVDMAFDWLMEVSASDVFAAARLLACCTPEASAWINTLLLKKFGTQLKDEEVRSAVATRLGMDVCHPHPCRCGEMADSRGYHGLSCQTGGAVIARHDEICDVLCRAANTAGLRARREPQGLCKDDAKRPDIVTQLPLSSGKPWAADFTCANTVALTYLPKTSKKAGAAAEQREQHKAALYQELEEDYVVSGIAFETFGSFGPEALKMVSLLGKRICERTGEPRAHEFLRQRLSVALQRGNARCIMGTFKENRGLEEVFYAVFR